MDSGLGEALLLNTSGSSPSRPARPRGAARARRRPRPPRPRSGPFPRANGAATTGPCRRRDSPPAASRPWSASSSRKDLGHLRDVIVLADDDRLAEGEVHGHAEALPQRNRAVLREQPLAAPHGDGDDRHPRVACQACGARLELANGERRTHAGLGKDADELARLQRRRPRCRRPRPPPSCRRRCDACRAAASRRRACRRRASWP